MQNYSYKHIGIRYLLWNIFARNFFNFRTFYIVNCDHSMKSKTVSLHCGYADAKILAKAMLKYVFASEISTLISLINVKIRLLILKKNPPSMHISTLNVYWFFRFIPPSTHRLLQLCASFFQKIPPSTFISTSKFIDFATFAPPPRLLERWEHLHSLSQTNWTFLDSLLNSKICQGNKMLQYYT